MNAWQRFQRGEAVDGDVAPAILASWHRSRDAGVDPHAPRFVRVDDLDLRLAHNRQLIAVAQPHLAWATRRFATGHVIYLVDRDGVVLEAMGEPADLRERAQRIPGVDWSEPAMGTSGAGTALATREPVVVHGSEHWCRAWHDTSCCGCPVRGSDGQIVGAIDLTASADDGHREHLMAVRHIVYAIEQELALLHAGTIERELRRRAEDATRSRDELLAIVSHHLRTPLALVATSAALLEQLLSPAAGSEVELQLGQIMAATDRMRSQLKNLLDAGRLEAGRVKPRLDSHSLLELVTETATDLTPLARRRGQHITLDVDATLHVRCDRELTLQVLWNLVENAVKFAPDASAIELRGQREGNRAHVCVVDRGPGIEPESLSRIFDRYFQARRRSRDGVGLGLYIARSFAEAQGAAVSVVSAPGHGSEFCIELPLADP